MLADAIAITSFINGTKFKGTSAIAVFSKMSQNTGSTARQGPQREKSSFKIKLFYYCGLLLVLNHCQNHREIPSAVLLLPEIANFVIHVIDFSLREVRALQKKHPETY